MKETMETYVLESSKTLHDNLENRDKLVEKIVDTYKSSNKKNICIVASGSSYNSALCALPYMKRVSKVDIELISPYTFTNYRTVKEDTFYMVISQGGESTNSIEALEYLKRNNQLAIGVTGNVNSSLKDYADVVIDYGVGEEKVGYVTKGVVTLILFLELFALYIGKDNDEMFNQEIKDIENAISYYPTVIDKTKKFIENNYIRLTTMKQCYVLGNETCFGIASEAALKIGETVHIPTSAHESEEFLHGPNLQLDPTYTVFVIDGNDKTSIRTKEIYNAVKSIGCATYYIAACGEKEEDATQFIVNANVKHELLPFVYLPLFQLLSNTVTTDLNRWQKHPMYKHFNDNIRSKMK